MPESILDLIGNTPLVEVTRARHRPVPAVPQAGEPEPGRLDQGPHRPVDDRGGRARRPAAAGRHHRRGDRRQHRARPGAGGARRRATRSSWSSPTRCRREKILHLRALGAEVRMTRSDVGKGHPEYYQDMAAAHRRARRRAPSTSTSSATRPTRWRTRPPPARRSGSRWTARRRRGGRAASARAARSPASARFFARVVADDARWCWPIRRARCSPTTCKTGDARRGRARWVVEGIGEDFVPADRRPVAGARRPTRSPTRRASPTARELLRTEGILGGSSTGHAARRGAALLPRADRAEARGHVRLRQRQQVPLQDVQRLLDARAGLARARRSTATCAT